MTPNNASTSNPIKYETNEDRLRTILHRHWPAWKLGEELGKGSYATVFRVHRDELGRRVEAALKHIAVPRDEAELRDLGRNQGLTHPDEISDYYTHYIQDKRREIDLYRDLRVTNVIAYEDHAIIPREGAPGYDILIRMELLTALTDYFALRPLTVRDAVLVGIDVLTALAECQQRAIIHRDVKPANIFVRQERGARPVYKLGDFGVGRQQESSASKFGTIAGTPIYMAPEIHRGETGYKYDIDQYALGLTLYQMLNHRRLPFEPPRLTSQARDDAFGRRVKGEVIPPPEYGGADLFRILLRACAYSPENRYALASDMKRDLLAVLDRELLDQPLGLSDSERDAIETSGGMSRLREDLIDVGQKATGKQPEDSQETIFLSHPQSSKDMHSSQPKGGAERETDSGTKEPPKKPRLFWVLAILALIVTGIIAVVLPLRNAGPSVQTPTIAVESITPTTVVLSLNNALLSQNGKAVYSLVYGPAISGVQQDSVLLRDVERSLLDQNPITLESLAPNTHYRLYAVQNGVRHLVADFATPEAPSHPTLSITQKGPGLGQDDARLAFVKHNVQASIQEANVKDPYSIGSLSRGDGSFSAQGCAAYVKFMLFDQASSTKPYVFTTVLRIGSDTYAWRHDDFTNVPPGSVSTIAIPIQDLLDALYAANGNRWPSDPLTVSFYADGQLVGHGALTMTK